MNILTTVNANSRTSTRQIARENAITRASVTRILHFHKLHSYHMSLHQVLHGRDFENRENFCLWCLKRIVNDRTFFGKILFTEGVIFMNRDQINSKKKYVLFDTMIHDGYDKLIKKDPRVSIFGMKLLIVK